VLFSVRKTSTPLQECVPQHIPVFLWLPADMCLLEVFWCICGVPFSMPVRYNFIETLLVI
jgi:hypothetical protein